jgi:hypothetical protein
MKKVTLQQESKAQLLLDATVKRMKALQEQECYEESLNICLQLTRTYPEIAGPWVDAAINCARLGRWQESIRYAQMALTRGGEHFAPAAMLAHAYGEIKQWDQARLYGLQVLNMRARCFSGDPVIPLSSVRPLPPLPSAQTRERNVIAFSLFGDDSKYCEPAVLNVQEQPHVYPHWICRFYVDASVPERVINRLRVGGAQIVQVEGAALQWPGPMWRLLALDDRQAHRILFRDADSVISPREAHAVEQWLASGKRFHAMRDWGSHTDLILAGLWGVVAGSLPPLEKLMECFMNVPLQSRHFADQDFLRQYVWPYARASLMQHDSVFNFMDAVPFPNRERPSEDFHVGYVESAPSFTFPSDQPDGSKVSWALYRIIEKLEDGQIRDELICAYTNVVRNGVVNAHIPKRYARWIEQGMAGVRLVRGEGN